MNLLQACSQGGGTSNTCPLQNLCEPQEIFKSPCCGFKILNLPTRYTLCTSCVAGVNLKLTYDVGTGVFHIMGVKRKFKEN